jgi:hypothetical protein
MNTNTLIAPAPAKAKLRFFTLYADFPAGVRAKRLVSRIVSRAGHDWEASTEMWKLDSVTPIAAIRDLIAQEAGESDVLLIASSAMDQPEPAVVHWLNSLVNWKLNRPLPGLLVGLPGNEEQKAGETNWLVEQLAAFARRTQMNFVWRTAGRDAAEDLEWLVIGLERLLERRRSCVAETAPAEFATVMPA